jgi:membrane fusion protein (multidrug efflux system)
MTRTIRAFAIILVGAALLGAAACSKGANGAEPTVGRPPVAVGVAAVTVKDLAESVDVVGTLAPKFYADVKSEVTGVVRDVYVTEWVPVRRGARLARLDTTETEAGIEALRAGEAQARVAETRAKREYERAQQLKQYGLITQQNLDDAKSAVEAAEAATAAARAQIKTAEARLAKSYITAPMDGTVALRGVSVGDRVENMGGGSPVFRIVDNRRLELTVSVPSTYVAALRVGQPLEFTTDTLPGRTFTGKVSFINPALDEATRSARVVAEVPNADGALRGGAFVKGRIVLATRAGVMQVPKEALQNWDLEAQTAEVFVVAGDKAQKRAIKIGKANGVSVEVLSGVQAGDRVVTRGAFNLREGDRLQVAAGEGA